MTMTIKAKISDGEQKFGLCADFTPGKKAADFAESQRQKDRWYKIIDRLGKRNFFLQKKEVQGDKTTKQSSV